MKNLLISEIKQYIELFEDPKNPLRSTIKLDTLNKFLNSLLEERKNKRNAAICHNCNSYIESKHRHDFVTCKCKNLSIDGGLDYVKINCTDFTKAEFLVQPKRTMDGNFE